MPKLVLRMTFPPSYGFHVILWSGLDTVRRGAASLIVGSKDEISGRPAKLAPDGTQEGP